MDFPAVDRVIYDHNPLVNVICQLQFPRVLMLEEHIPADFQKILGNRYPFVETREVLQFTLNARSEERGSSPAHRTQYEFYTEDRNYSITLSSEFIAIGTTKYQRWEVFCDHISNAIQALVKAYPIPLFTRVGLRYIDVISKRRLSLEGDRWSDLIRASALGILTEEIFSIKDMLELNNAALVKLDGVGKAVFRTAFGRTPETGDEIVFIVDGDIFEDEAIRGAQNAIDACSEFNKVAGRAFRWFISDKLHQALGPQHPAKL